MKSAKLISSAAAILALTAAIGAALPARAADAYIESDGTQAINSGYFINARTKIEIDFQLTEVVSQARLFGQNGTGAGNYTVVYFGDAADNIKFGYGNTFNGVFLAANNLDRNTIVYDGPGNKGYLYQNGVEIASANLTAAHDATANFPMGIFAESLNAMGTSFQSFAKMRLYGLKVYEDNALVHSFEPAVNGVTTGLVDTVTGKFLHDARANGGAFAGGGDLQEVEEDPYVESDGTSAINTGYFLQPGTRIEVDYALKDLSTTQIRLFGQDTTSPKIGFYIQNSLTLALGIGQADFKTPFSSLPTDLARRTCVVDVPGQYACLLSSLGGTNAVGTIVQPPTAVATRPIALFGDTTNDAGTSFNNKAACRIYRAKFYVGGALVRDFVPRCINGEAGFEDVMSGGFYTCAGLTASANAPTALSGRSKEGDAYIESDGSYYSVVDTRYFVNSKTKIEIDYQLASIVSGGIVLGGYGANAGISTILWCNGTSKLELEMHDGNHNSTADTLFNPAIPIDIARHTAVFDGPGRHLSLKKPDGTVEAEADFPSSWTLNNTANWPMLLFGSATSAYGKSTQRAKARIFSVKVYEDGALVHNFSPWVKGGVPGFKDAESDEFFSGGGLTAGGNVQEEEDDPYVENPTGGRFFDTGVYVTSNTCVVCDFMPLVQQNNQQFPFEAGDSISATNANKKMFMRMYGNGGAGTGDYAYACGGDMFQTTEVPYAPLVRRKITLNAYNLVCKVETASGVTIREKAIAAKGRSPVNKSSSTLKLLANANMNANSCKARLYGFKIYEKGTLTHDYVPICQAGTYALLDKVEGKVLAKAANSTAFTGYTGNSALNDAFFTAPMRNEDAYIESDGTQGINLGYFTKPDTRYEIDYAMTAIVGQNRPFGEATGALSAELYIQGTATGSGNVAFGVGDTWVGQPSGIASDLNRHVALLDLANHECGYSGKGLYAFTSATVCSNTATYPMWLFAKGTSASGGHSNRTKMKLYAFRIFEAGVLVHEYLPYKVGDVVGLYDTMTGDVIGNTVSGGNAFTYGGGLGYGKFAGNLTNLVMTPTDVLISVNGTRTLSAFAPGAVRYVWTRNGEEIEGVYGAECVAAWEKPAKTGPVVYGVTPVFTKGGEDVFGATATAEATMAPTALIMVVR